MARPISISATERRVVVLLDDGKVIYRDWAAVGWTPLEDIPSEFLEDEEK